MLVHNISLGSRFSGHYKLGNTELALAGGAAYLEGHVGDVDLVAAPLSEELDFRNLSGANDVDDTGGGGGAGFDFSIPIVAHGYLKQEK